MKSRAASVGLLVVLLSAAWGAGAPAGALARAASTPSAMTRWNRAYTFLKKETTWPQVLCDWLREADGKTDPVARTARFYSYTNTAWRHHIISRWDAIPAGTFESCEAVVPTTIPWGPQIDVFLSRYGLVFGPSTNGLTSIEVAYAGQSAQDANIIYRHKPGLFGLRLALSPLGISAFVARSTRIIQPTDTATASLYLRLATPLLDWYGYNH